MKVTGPRPANAAVVQGGGATEGTVERSTRMNSTPGAVTDSVSVTTDTATLAAQAKRRVKQLNDERQTLIAQFKTLAKPLGSHVIAALQDEDDARGGLHVRTADDDRRFEAAKKAIEADPLTSSWTPAARAKLYWHVAVSGRSTLDVTMSELITRHLTKDPSLSAEARTVLARIYELSLEIRAWQSVYFTLHEQKGTRTDLETQERQLFEKGIASGAIQRPTEAQLKAAVASRTSARGFTQIVGVVMVERPRLAWVLEALEASRKLPGEENVSALYNEVWPVARALATIDAVANPSTSAIFETARRDAVDDWMWPGFGLL